MFNSVFSSGPFLSFTFQYKLVLATGKFSYFLRVKWTDLHNKLYPEDNRNNNCNYLVDNVIRPDQHCHGVHRTHQYPFSPPLILVQKSQQTLCLQEIEEAKYFNTYDVVFEEFYFTRKRDIPRENCKTFFLYNISYVDYKGNKISHFLSTKYILLRLRKFRCVFKKINQNGSCKMTIQHLEIYFSSMKINKDICKNVTTANKLCDRNSHIEETLTRIEDSKRNTKFIDGTCDLFI